MYNNSLLLASRIGKWGLRLWFKFISDKARNGKIIKVVCVIIREDSGDWNREDNILIRGC